MEEELKVRNTPIYSVKLISPSVELQTLLTERGTNDSGFISLPSRQNIRLHSYFAKYFT